MADYNHAFRVLMDFEGTKYEDIETDRGGPTKFGVTLPVLQEFADKHWHAVVDVDILKNLKIVTAQEIFLEQWWNRFGYREIKSTEVATRVLLASVLFGPSRGHKIIQRACNCAGRNLVEDGLFWVLSKGAVNTIHDGILIPVFRAVCQGYVEVKYARRPSDEENSPGWMVRAEY